VSALPTEIPCSRNWPIISKLGEPFLTSVSPVPILLWVYRERNPTLILMPDYARPAAPGIVTVAVTGASGVVFARELLLALERDSRVETVNFIASDNALRVMAEELGITGRGKLLEQLLAKKTAKIQQQNNDDIGANVASGSYPADAMIVIPCSMGTLGRIANGISNKLIERAADVCLKERRPLVLCVRETPLNKIHIRNMSLAADAGATIFPLIPAFYTKPESVEAMARDFANRVLAHIGLPQPRAFRWMG
jgi:flavin prenyltransferase